jgi:hypothetical protein
LHHKRLALFDYFPLSRIVSAMYQQFELDVSNLST